MLIFKEKIKRYSILWWLFPCLFALLLDKNRIILNVMWAKGKIICNDWQHTCLLFLPLCCYLVHKTCLPYGGLAESGVSTFCQIVMHNIFVTFFPVMSKRYNWPIIAFNWIFLKISWNTLGNVRNSGALQNLGWKALAQRMVTKFWQLLGLQSKPFNLHKPHLPYLWNKTLSADLFHGSG